MNLMSMKLYQRKSIIQILNKDGIDIDSDPLIKRWLILRKK